MPRFTSALAAYRGLLMVLFRPPGRVTFCSRQKSNQKRLPHVSALRFAPGPLTPVPLRGHLHSASLTGRGASLMPGCSQDL